jgi:hypothetical protein
MTPRGRRPQLPLPADRATDPRRPWRIAAALAQHGRRHRRPAESRRDGSKFWNRLNITTDLATPGAPGLSFATQADVSGEYLDEIARPRS